MRYIKNKKRGQVSAFIFLGILIIFILGITIAGVKQIVSIKLKEAADKQIDDVLYTQNIQNYVQRCVRDTTKQALITIGEQGGYIFKEQVFYLNNSPPKKEISLGDKLINITTLEYNNITEFVSPNYPCLSPLKWGCGEELSGVHYCKFVNRNNKCKFCKYLFECLPKLTRISFEETQNENINNDEVEEETNNERNNENQIQEQIFNVSYTNATVEEMIAAYITNKTYECINFSRVNKTFPLFKIEAKNITTNVNLGLEKVSIEVNYPIEVSIFNRPIKTRIISFSDEEKNRLGQILNFVKLKLLKDSKKLEYDINLNGGGDLNTLFGSDSGLNLLINKDISPGTDLIKIIDTKYDLLGKPYVFQFLRENVNPALDYFPTNGPVRENYDYITFISLENPDLNKITIEPKANDANEDELTYHYYGWKAEFEQNYWIIGTNTGCVKPFFEYGEIPDNFVCSNLIYSPENFGENAKFTTNITKELDENLWENSEDYIETQRIANLILNYPDDLGPHNTTIIVNDEHGLKDWQIIRIFIDREIKAILDPCNIYNYLGLDTSFSCEDGSIEDPFVLDGTRSITSLLDDTIVNFDDDVELWGEKGMNKPLCSVIPTFIECEENNNIFNNFNIVNITNVIYNFNVSDPSNHEITMSLSAGVQSDSDFKNVNVHQCLPFRNEDSPAFPYNTTNGFLANHTCCNNDMTLKGTNSKCYYDDKINWFGGFDGFIYEFNKIIEGYEHTSINRGIIEPDWYQQNDIFKLEATRYCDGTRGNICAGDIVFNYKIIESCDDTTFGTGERCVGPNPITKDSCYNYTPRTTFESIFGSLFEIEGTGVCNDTPACEGDTLVYNWTCDGRGGCTQPNIQKDCNILDNYYGNLHENLRFENYTCGTEESNVQLDAFDENDLDCVILETIDLDENKELCEGCNNEYEQCNDDPIGWLGDDENGYCCGNDENEYYREGGVFGGSGCCQEKGQCWNVTFCVNEGIEQKYHGDNGDSCYICENGVWVYDLENNCLENEQEDN